RRASSSTRCATSPSVRASTPRPASTSTCSPRASATRSRSRARRCSTRPRSRVSSSPRRPSWPTSPRRTRLPLPVTWAVAWTSDRPTHEGAAPDGAAPSAFRGVSPLEEEPHVALLDLGVLLAGLGEGAADRGEVVPDALLGHPPLGIDTVVCRRGPARPRRLQLLELRVERGDLVLDAPDGLSGGRRVGEDGFAVYLECAHGATLGAGGHPRDPEGRIRGCSESGISGEERNQPGGSSGGAVC